MLVFIARIGNGPGGNPGALLRPLVGCMAPCASSFTSIKLLDGGKVRILARMGRVNERGIRRMLEWYWVCRQTNFEALREALQ